MIITIRGTDINKNKAAHTTALLAGLNAVRRSRKTLIIHMCQGDATIEDMLIGKRNGETDIFDDIDFISDDTGLDALMVRVPSMRIQKEHFDACSTSVLSADNLLDILNPSKQADFATDLVEKKEYWESLLAQANEIYDDIYIFTDSTKTELQQMVDSYADISIVCIRQGKKEPISNAKDNAVYVITGYDKNSNYNVRLLKATYKVKNMVALPYSVEYKDAYNNANLINFIGANDKISSDDINYALFSAASDILTKFLEKKEDKRKKKEEIEEVEEELTSGEEFESTNKEEMEEFVEPTIEVVEKKGLFKKKKIVTPIYDEVEELSELPEESDEVEAAPITEAIDFEELPEEEFNDIVEVAEKIAPSTEAESETKPKKEKKRFGKKKKTVESVEEPVVEAEPVKMQAPSEVADWTCPECGEVNPAKAKFCFECGSKKPATEWTCPECGEINPAKAKFCFECGTKR